MTELEPFLESCDDFERTLLHSIGRDQPTPDAAAKTVAALRLAATVGSGVATGALSARSLNVWTILKGLGVGAVVGSAVMVAAGQLRQSPANAPHIAPVAVGASSHSSTSRTPPVVPEQNQTRGLEAVSGVGAPKPMTSVQLPAHRAPSGEAATLNPPADRGIAPMISSTAVASFAPSGAGTTHEAPNAVSIAEQVRVIDQARSALTHGRASEALDYTRSYTQRWPNGGLSTEAIIVRIEAELALGDRTSAERDARSVIAALPGSRYVTRAWPLFAAAYRVIAQAGSFRAL